MRKYRLPQFILSGFPLALACAAPSQAAGDDFPAWRSLRDPLVNMRAGPGEDYAIRFVYHRQHLPVKGLRAYQGWVFVQDADGARGWIMLRFLAKAPNVLIRGAGPVEMRAGPGRQTPLLWRLAPGVVGRLGECREGWCRIDVDKRVGFVPQDRLWGVGKP